MNKGIRFFVIIMLIALFGFSAASCDNNNNSSKPWPQATWKSGDVQISFYQGGFFLIKINKDYYLKGRFNFYTNRIEMSSMERLVDNNWMDIIFGTSTIYYTGPEPNNTWTVTSVSSNANVGDKLDLLKNKTFAYVKQL